MNAVLQKLYDNPTYSDGIVSMTMSSKDVKGESSDIIVNIKIMRAILCEAVPYFKMAFAKSFTVATVSSMPCVVVTGVTPRAFDVLLRHIHGFYDLKNPLNRNIGGLTTAEVFTVTSDASLLFEVYEMAHRLDYQPMMAMCVERVLELPTRHKWRTYSTDAELLAQWASNLDTAISILTLTSKVGSGSKVKGTLELKEIKDVKVEVTKVEPIDTGTGTGTTDVKEESDVKVTSSTKVEVSVISVGSTPPMTFYQAARYACLTILGQTSHLWSGNEAMVVVVAKHLDFVECIAMMELDTFAGIGTNFTRWFIKTYPHVVGVAGKSIMLTVPETSAIESTRATDLWAKFEAKCSQSASSGVGCISRLKVDLFDRLNRDVEILYKLDPILVTKFPILGDVTRIAPDEFVANMCRLCNMTFDEPCYQCKYGKSAEETECTIVHLDCRCNFHAHCRTRCGSTHWACPVHQEFSQYYVKEDCKYKLPTRI
jgi:hypothetical protein